MYIYYFILYVFSLTFYRATINKFKPSTLRNNKFYYLVDDILYEIQLLREFVPIYENK